MRAILTTFGTEGSITPLVTLATTLLRRGHQVSLLTNQRHCARFAGLGFELVPLDSEQDFRSFVRDGHELSTPDRVPDIFRRYYFPRVQSEISLIAERVFPETPCVLVASETPGIAARIAAERLRVPLVSVLIQPNHLSTMEIYTSLIGCVLRAEVNHHRVAAGLPPREDLRAWWQEVDRYLALWPEWFAPAFSGHPQTTYAGLIGYEPVAAEEASRSSAQERRSPSVLITGGTAHLASRAFFSSLCEALAGTAGRKVLLCSQREILPAHVPEDLETVPWVRSFPAALHGVDVLIHHGGMGTISQALPVGVPQLVLADGGDRPENGRFIEELGVGLFLPRTDWTAPKIRAAVTTLTESTTIRARCAELASRCDAAAATEVAARCLESAAALPGRAERGRLAQPAPAVRYDERPARLAALSADRSSLLMARIRAAIAGRGTGLGPKDS